MDKEKKADGDLCFRGDKKYWTLSDQMLFFYISHFFILDVHIKMICSSKAQ